MLTSPDKQQAPGTRIKTFYASLSLHQSSFTLRLPCTPFRVLAVSLEERGTLALTLALPPDGLDKQEYRFYLYDDEQVVEHSLDNYLASVNFPSRGWIHLFGAHGYSDPHIRWMGNASDPDFRQPEFVLWKLGERPQRTGGTIISE